MKQATAVKGTGSKAICVGKGNTGAPGSLTPGQDPLQEWKSQDVSYHLLASSLQQLPQAFSSKEPAAVLHLSAPT